LEAKVEFYTATRSRLRLQHLSGQVECLYKRGVPWDTTQYLAPNFSDNEILRADEADWSHRLYSWPVTLDDPSRLPGVPVA
jgi:hypothetical protein